MEVIAYFSKIKKNIPNSNKLKIEILSFEYLTFRVIYISPNKLA